MQQKGGLECLGHIEASKSWHAELHLRALQRQQGTSHPVPHASLLSQSPVDTGVPGDCDEPALRLRRPVPPDLVRHGLLGPGWLAGAFRKPQRKGELIEAKGWLAWERSSDSAQGLPCACLWPARQRCPQGPRPLSAKMSRILVLPPCPTNAAAQSRLQPCR